MSNNHNRALVIGRIVHYRSHGSRDGTHPSTCRPAMVIEVLTDEGDGEEDLILKVETPTGEFRNESEWDGERFRGGTWHWNDECPEDL